MFDLIKILINDNLIIMLVYKRVLSIDKFNFIIRNYTME